MQVLEDEHGEPPAALLPDQTLQRREQRVPARGGVRGLHALFTRRAQQIEQQRKVVWFLVNRLLQARLHLGAHPLGRILVPDVEVSTKEVEKERERHRTTVRRGSQMPHRHRLRAALCGELKAEATLADARLARDADDASISACTAFQRAVEQIELPLATDEARLLSGRA